MFNGGALTAAESIARLLDRKNQVDPAIIAEAARWGDSKVATPRTKTTWQTEVNWLVNTYFPSRGNTVLGQLRADGLYTTFSAPAFSQHGGEVLNNYPLTMTAGAGTIYFTTDGVTDPRSIGGAVNPSAAVKQYTGGVPISGATTVMARLRTASGQWSGLVEATFSTVALAGDYNGNGSVDQADYGVWRAGFGSAVTPGSGADGNGNGAVDAADYTVWRDNLGATLALGSGSGSGGFDDFASEITLVEAAEGTALANDSVAEPIATSSLAFVAADNLSELSRPNNSWVYARQLGASRPAFDNLQLASLRSTQGSMQDSPREQAFDEFELQAASLDDDLFADDLFADLVEDSFEAARLLF
jgi:hypothetical protein